MIRACGGPRPRCEPFRPAQPHLAIPAEILERFLPLRSDLADLAFLAPAVWYALFACSASRSTLFPAILEAPGFNLPTAPARSGWEVTSFDDLPRIGCCSGTLRG